MLQKIGLGALQSFEFFLQAGLESFVLLVQLLLLEVQILDFLLLLLARPRQAGLVLLKLRDLLS